MFRTCLLATTAAAVLAFGTLITTTPAQAQCTARFTCDPGVSPVCWFRLFYRNGNSSVFTVPAGGQRRIFGLSPGERYCSSNRGTPGFQCNSQRIRMAC
jgi:hypothetical protein